MACSFAYGFWMALLSMGLMATFAILTKIFELPNSTLLLTTGTAIFIYALIVKTEAPLFRFDKNLILFVAFECIDFLGRTSMVYFLPISLAVAINCSTPVYSAILERFTDPYRYDKFTQLKRSLCILTIVLFISVQAFASNTDKIHINFIGIGLALMSALARVLVNVLIESNLQDYDIHQIFSITGVGYMVMSLPFFILNGGSISPFNQWCQSILTGVVFAITGYTLIETFANKDITVTNALAIRTLTIPTGLVIGVCFLHEEFTTIIGCANLGITIFSLVLVLMLGNENDTTTEMEPLIQEHSVKLEPFGFNKLLFVENEF